MSYNTKWLRNNGPIPGPSTPPRAPEQDLADTAALMWAMTIVSLIIGISQGAALGCGIFSGFIGFIVYLMKKKELESVHGRRMPKLFFSSDIWK